MKKRFLSILLCLCMVVTLLPTAAFAEETATATVFGLTITGTKGGFETHDTDISNYPGAIMIKSAGTYTISGTYADTNLAEYTWRQSHVYNPQWRGIIDVTQATGDVILVLDNVNLQTYYKLNMPVILERTGTGAAKVTIQLKGNNTLAALNVSSGGAIVKQGGSGSLTFTGDGNLAATAAGVAIGSPFFVSAGTSTYAYNCTNLTFAQTGTISATSTLGNCPAVGAASGYADEYMTTTATGITVSSGTLNLSNTDANISFFGALLGASSWVNYLGGYYDDIQITGGTIIGSTPNDPAPGISVVGGRTPLHENSLSITGGTIIANDGLTPADHFFYGAYIATNDVVKTLSVKINGESYTYNASGVTAQSGKVWFYLPQGNAAVTLNGTTYYGTVDKSNNTELTSNFTPIADITVSPTEMAAHSTITLAGTVAPDGATFKTVSKYEILNAGNTSATLAGLRLTAPAGGTIALRATVYGGNADGSNYTKDFSITSKYQGVTDITGIPDTLQNGVTVMLTPNITPANASYQTVKWTLKSGIATLEGSRLTPTAPGEIKLTATVENGSAYGTAYTKDFTITVPTVLVTGLSGSVPSTLTISKTFDLSAISALPENASYRDIAWTVDPGSTGASITDNILTATAAGTLTLTATITNGRGAGQNYTQDYTIAVLGAGDELDISVGTITITSKDATTNTVTFAGYNGGSKDVAKADTLVVITDKTTANQIIVDGTTANILLKDINISITNNLYTNCIDLKNNASLTLAAQGTCTLSNTTLGTAYAAAIHVPVGTSLTLQDGDGTLSATSTNGAGIGGNRGDGTNNGEPAGTITIVGGTVTATSDNGAGIGGGYGSTSGAGGGAGGNITINGGNVTATGTSGAGIGGGYGYTGGAGGTVKINGGNVTATSSNGAGIGGGSGSTTGGAGGTVTILDGTVTATGNSGAGIGGGYGSTTGGAGGSVNISGGNVTVKNDSMAAAIGGGKGTTNGGAGGAVSISGGTVNLTAHPYWGAMAVGAGLNNSYTPAGNNGTLTITGGSIKSNISLTGGTSGYKQYTCISATNGVSGSKVYCTTADLSDFVGKSTALTGANSITAATNYGFTDVATDADGKIYLYLPENASHTAILGGTSGYTGSTKTDDTGTLTLENFTPVVNLGTPYLTGDGITVSATPNLAGTVYYLAVKDGAETLYADADALKAATDVKTAAVTANTATTLTGMAGIEGDYTVYAALISASETYKSAVATATIHLAATAPAVSDAQIDYSAETLKAAADLGYNLQYFTSEGATTGGTEITAAGVSVTALMGNTVYVRKVFTDNSVGSAALALAIPARPEAPAAPTATAAATSITVTAVSGTEYRIDNGTWQQDGSFTGLTAVKNYTIYARTAATSSAFASEAATTTVSTVATVAAPTKTGDGAAFAGNTVTADRETVGADQSVTYTVTAISGYTPTLTVGGSAVALAGDASPYTFIYTPTEGTASVAAAASFDGAAIATVTHANVTLFADDEKNASQEALESSFAGTSVTAKDADGNSLGTLTASYTLKTGTWEAQGGSYTYTATASNNKTCEFTVTVKPVNAAITAVEPISLMMKPTDGYATHAAIGLPENLTVTYTGDGYTRRTDALAASWSAVPTDFGKAATAENTPAAFTGTVTLPAWAAGTNTTTAHVTITPKNTATVTVTQADATYPNTLTDPEISVTDKNSGTLTDTSKLTIRYSGTLSTNTDYAASADKPTQPGTYTVTVTYEDDTNYGIGSDEFVINKAPSDPNLDDSNGENTYTYGSTITLTATPVMVQALEDEITPPAANTVDFYYQKSETEFIKLNGDTPIALENGTATFAYDTKTKTLPIGESTIVAAYGGSDVLQAGFDSMTVTLNAKPLTALWMEPPAKTYDGGAGFTDVAVTLGDVENGDTVTATATLTASSKNAGDNLTIATVTVTLSGEQASWYTAPTTLSGTVSVGKKAISVASASVTDKEYDGGTTTSATVTFTGLVGEEKLAADTDYTVAAAFQSADVSDSATADVTVTLKDTTSAANYYFESDANSKTTGTAKITAKAISGTVSVALDADVGEIGIADTGDTLKATGYLPAGATLTYLWKVAGVDAGADATYTVKAEDAGKLLTVTVTGSGNYSGELTSASYKIGARTLAGTVAITGATTVGGTVTAALTSTSGTPNMGADYRIQWYRVSGETATAIEGANALAYTLTNADLGKTLRVELIAGLNNSAFSGTVLQTLDIPAVKPAAPVILASADDGKVTLGWSTPFDGGSALTGYRLYVKAGTGAYGAAIDIAASATNYDATGLTNGTTYTFKLAAVNAIGETESAEISATPKAANSGGNGGGSSTTTYYTITTSAGAGGYFSTGTTVQVPAGDSAGFTITPNKGYAIADVQVDGKSVGAVSNYVFTNVRANHTISATFKAADHTNPQTGADNPFADVKESDWFFNDVMFVYENQLMLGTSATTFSPNDTTTRAMVATILWRMEGSPEVTGSSGFTDVPEGKYYTTAVAWAKQNNIVNGYSDTTFGPEKPVTREQLAAFFYRYAQYKDYDTEISASISSFGDSDKVSTWAVDAMKWAVGYGVIQGKTGNLLDPQGNATRAQLAAMLHRLIEKNELVAGVTTTGLMGWIDPKQLKLPNTGDMSSGAWPFALCAGIAGCAVLLLENKRRARHTEA